MGTVLKGATLVEFEPASVEIADLRVSGGRIVGRGEAAAVQPDDEVIDFTGRLITPGLVSAHHRLSATLLRGARRADVGLTSELLVQRALTQVMTPDDAQAAAAAGALEGLACGTTTVFDTHRAASDWGEGLSRVAKGLNDVGLRAVLAHELNGAKGDLEALEACRSYGTKARGRFRGAMGLARLARLSDEVLRSVKDAADQANLFTLVAVAEDRDEELQSLERFGRTPVVRLLEAGLVGERTVMAQGVHLAWPDLSKLLTTGAWLVHTARSNMASQTGHATAAKFGVRATFGTDVLPLDVWAEAQTASLRANDSGQPIDLLRFLANGHRLASAAFGLPMGPLREGAAADLVVLDYPSPTPLDADSLGAHLLTGFSSRHVEAVMVDGLWRLWKRKPLAADPTEIARAAQQAAAGAWRRMAEVAEVAHKDDAR